MTTTDRLTALAQSLDNAWTDATTVPAPSTADPSFTLESAYEVQDRIISSRLERGRTRSGWKMGLTTAGPGTTPIVGTLLDDMVVPSGATLSLQTMVAPMVEAEVVVRIGETIDRPATVAELESGPHRIGPGLEVIDYRTTHSTGPTDWVADNSTVAYAVVGAMIPIGNVKPAQIEAKLSGQAGPLAAGRGELVMGNPIAAVTWLSEHLLTRGHWLESGDIILTGSLTGHHPVTPGTATKFAADFGELGSVDVRFGP